MKTLIVYASNQKCTGNIVVKMKEYLGEKAVLVNLKKESNPSIKEFQRIIIGGSIRAGKIQKQVNTFCTKNLDELLKKELGLFICCMEEGRTARSQLINAYPEALYNIAKSTAIFNGRFDFNRMNFLEKMFVRKVSRVRQNSSKVDYEAVHKFSKRMDRIFNPFLFIA